MSVTIVIKNGEHTFVSKIEYDEVMNPVEGSHEVTGYKSEDFEREKVDSVLYYPQAYVGGSGITKADAQTDVSGIDSELNVDTLPTNP